MFLKITKSKGEVKRCELRKDLRYGRGKVVLHEKVKDALVQR